MEKYATNHEAFLTKFKSQCDEREAGSCCCSVAKSCPTLWDPWTAARQASLSFTIALSLFKLMSIESMMPSNRLILCSPLLLLPSIFPRIRAFPVSLPFASGGQRIGASASASVLSVNIQGWFPLGLSGLIAVRGTPKSLLRHHKFESINSLVISLLYGPTLTSVHDY